MRWALGLLAIALTACSSSTVTETVAVTPSAATREACQEAFDLVSEAFDIMSEWPLIPADALEAGLTNDLDLAEEISDRMDSLNERAAAIVEPYRAAVQECLGT
jgi:hypothetical protein